MKKRQAAYWKERFSILNQASSEYGQAVYAQIEDAFMAAQRDIQRDIDAWYARFASNNGVTLVEAKRLLNSRELSELKWDIGQYIKYGKQNALDGKWVKQLENASARFHITRLEALQLRTQQALEKAFGNELDTVDGLIRRTVTNDYYRTAFELQKGFGTGFDIGEISTRELDKIVKKPWTADGRTFSDRIWAKKRQMIGDLHNELTRCCIYGRSQKDAIARLEQYVDKSVKNAKYCARRIVVTEQAYFSSRSQYDALKELNVKEYEIDLPTAGCDICREMNGKHFPMSAYEVGSTAPPFHPNCENGGIIPYFDDSEFEVPEGAKPLSEDVSFEEWEKKFVRCEESENSVDYMSSSFRPQYSDRETTLTVGDISIKTKTVKNSKFNLLTDVDESRRSKAVRLTEKQLRTVSDMLPDNFDIPTTAVVDFEKYGLNPAAIAGYEKVSGIMYINSKYDTVEKILGYVNKQAGQFANTTEYAPVLHELGHKFYENSVKALAKSKNLEYNKAKDIIDVRIYDYIHARNNDGKFLLKNISRYADDGFADKNKYTEIVAECFSIRNESPIACEILNLLGDDAL